MVDGPAAAPATAAASALAAASMDSQEMVSGADGSGLAAPTATSRSTTSAAPRMAKKRRTFQKRKRPRGQWGYAASASASASSSASSAAGSSACAARTTQAALAAAVANGASSSAKIGTATAAAENPAVAAAGVHAAGGTCNAGVWTSVGASLLLPTEGFGRADDADNNQNDGDEEETRRVGDEQSAAAAAAAIVPAAAAVDDDDGDNGRAEIKTKSKAKSKAKAKAKCTSRPTMTDEEFAQITGLVMTARNSTGVAEHVPPVHVPPPPPPMDREDARMGDDDAKKRKDHGGSGGGTDEPNSATGNAAAGMGQDVDVAAANEAAAGAKKPQPTATAQQQQKQQQQPPQPRRRPRWYEESSDDDDDWEEWLRRQSGRGAGGSGQSTAGGNASANPSANGHPKGGDEEKKEDGADEDGDAHHRNQKKKKEKKKKPRPTIRYDDIEDGIDRAIVDMLEDEEFDAIAAEMKEREEAQKRAEQEAREAKEREERQRVEREERERKEREEAKEKARKELAGRLRRDREARLARLRAAQSAAASAATAATTVARSAAAATSNATWAASSSSSVAALQAANAAYNALPAVAKPPAPAVPAPAPAPLPVAQLHRPPSPSQRSTTRVKSESSPTTTTGRGTGRLKDDRDCDDAPIKSDPADEEDAKPRIKSDPAKEEEKDEKEEKQVKLSADSASSPTAARAQPVDSSSYWTAVRVKQEEHAEWRQEIEERKENDNKKMYDTIEGKAFLFVEHVLEKHKELMTGDAVTDSLISPVARDDMTFMAERMFQEQQNFWSAGKPTRVDIAYHYTCGQNMGRIRTDGLMTHAERQANSVTSNYNGSVFGDGVYTGNGPFAFRAYGDVGLIVARMKGFVDRTEIGTARRDASAGIDTVIGNKRPKGGYVLPTAFSRSVRRVMENEGEISDEEDENGDRYEDEVVLRKSSQVIPLTRYSASLLDPSQMESPGNEQLHTFHSALQIVIDDFFNKGRKTWVKDYFIPRYARPVPPPPQNFAFGPGSFTGTPIVPSGSSTRRRGANPYSFTGGAAPFSGPGSRLGRYSSGSIAEIEYVAPYALDAPDCACDEIDLKASGEANDMCPICIDTFAEKGGIVAKMKKCGHSFCKDCMQEALSRNNRCPTCRTILGQVRGQMPTGKMSVTRSSMKCKGYENCRGSLVITYDIQAAVQRVYMQNPGATHSGKYETAYLPDNDEGRKLLERLKFAFSRGLTFVVGTSMTTGATNVVTWATIHHKTSPTQGPHGFPDPSYFANCNNELNNAGVPDFEECKKVNGTKSDDEDDDSVIEIE